MSKRKKDLFGRLRTLFVGGRPVVKRKVRNYVNAPSNQSLAAFKQAQSFLYGGVINTASMYDRMNRLNDFQEMDLDPILHAALDLYAEESCSQDANGDVLHIYSENSQIKDILEFLFYETLNVNFFLAPWVRNLCKYGDLFLLHEIREEYGVTNAYPIPVNEIEREDGFDPANPNSVRFRWISNGNRIIEDYEMSHFRLLGNDGFLPYGSSVLAGARRVWRQLSLLEDSMMIYRIVRSPERRVFYVDVGNVPPNEVENYMEQVKSSMRSDIVVNKDSGTVDQRFNALSVLNDYFLPTRAGESATKIDTLAGGRHNTDIDDIEYLLNKLFAAIKIPKAFLQYDEALSAKATLSMEDLRFSRTINNIQRSVLSELNKIAIIHLASQGFDDEDLLDFELNLSNPSTLAEQQKLELLRTKFEIMGTPTPGLFSRNYLRREVGGLTNEQIEQIDKELGEDREFEDQLETEFEGGGGGGFGGGGGGLGGEPSFGDTEEFGGGEEGELGGLGGAAEDEEEDFGEEPPEEESDEEEGRILLSTDENEEEIIYEDDEDEDEDDNKRFKLSMKDDDAPVKALTQMQKTIYNRRRKRRHGPATTQMPDFNKMISAKNKTFTDPFDKEYLIKGSPFKDNVNLSGERILDTYLSRKISQNEKLGSETLAMLSNFKNKIQQSKDKLLKEEKENENEDGEDEPQT